MLNILSTLLTKTLFFLSWSLLSLCDKLLLYLSLLHGKVSVFVKARDCRKGSSTVDRILELFVYVSGFVITTYSYIKQSVFLVYLVFGISKYIIGNEKQFMIYLLTFFFSFFIETIKKAKDSGFTPFRCCNFQTPMQCLFNHYFVLFWRVGSQRATTESVAPVGRPSKPIKISYLFIL